MILDTILLTSILGGIHYYKSNHPNFLFFPHKAALFLPPEDIPENRPTKKKGKVQHQVNVVKIQYENVKDYPFSNQFSRSMMTTFGLVIFILLKLIIGFFFPSQSLLTFYTLVLIFIYTIKIGLDTFFLTNYSKKNCFLLALGLNLIFFVFLMSFDSMDGVYDRTLRTIAKDYTKHLQIIFNRDITFVTHKTILGLIFIINFFVIIAVIPSIIKFGNWYAKTLKQIYYEQDQNDTMAMAKRVDSKQKDIKEQQKQLKLQSRQLINKLNVYLAVMLVLLFISHRYVLNFLDQRLVDALRGICMGVSSYIICQTMSKAIEFNGSFAYKFVLQFFETDDSQQRSELKKRIVPYIYYIWYHYFQYIVRLLIPVLLFLLIINWKYLSVQTHVVQGNIADRLLNVDIQCPISTDHLSILENLYRCPVKQVKSADTNSIFFLNGLLQSIPANLQPSTIQANVQKYGLLQNQMMTEFWQHMFWYSCLSIYLMTVVYILFLRKTVYDI